MTPSTLQLTSDPDHSPAAATRPAPEPAVPFRHRALLLLAFLAGGTVAVGVLQAGFLEAFAHPHAEPAPAPAPAPDPRLDRLLSLLEAERTCDMTCLNDLRAQADKNATLEDTLGRLQTEATAAAQRAADWEQAKTNLEAQLTQVRAEIEAARASQTNQATALEQRTAEKTALEEALSRSQASVTTLERRAAELDREKARLAGELDAARTAAAAKVATLEQRLAEAHRPPAMAPDQPRKGRRGDRVPEPAPAQAPVPPEWKILNLSANTVVVSTRDHKVVALAAGEALEGVTIVKIDPDQGLVETSAGPFTYRP
jgi:hypothetical protein